MQIRFTGHIYNLTELQSSLSLTPHPDPTQAVETVLTALWQRHGTEFPKLLYGDYALVISDPLKQQTFLVRSPLGVKPLYYRIAKDKVYSAFSARQLLNECPLPFTKCRQWIAKYILSTSPDQRTTAYVEMRKVAHSHCLLVGPNQTVKEWRFHEFVDDAPVTYTRDPVWVERYQEKLDNAIAVRIDPNHPMASENSGGIDSGTITALLARQLYPAGRRLWSMGFAMLPEEAQHIFETSRLRAVAQNYMVSSFMNLIDSDEYAKESIEILGFPVEHSNAVVHRPFYEQCQLQGIKSLFSGFGGDEVVTNHANLVLTEWADAKRYRLLWQSLPKGILHRTRRLARAVLTGFKPQTHNLALRQAFEGRFAFQPLKDEVIREYGIHEQMLYQSRFDGPYRRVNDFILDYHLRESTNIGTRNENCTVMAQHWGVDYRWPLWDVKLVQQYLSTPSIEKLGPDGMIRYLHRRAIDKRVPDLVAWKPTKAMGHNGQNTPQLQVQRAERLAQSLDGLIAELHPSLLELLDIQRLKALAAQPKNPQQYQAYEIATGQSRRALRLLNFWLQMG
jgi:asparagine synthase (glutamine-hydrolysing)